MSTLEMLTQIVWLGVGIMAIVALMVYILRRK